MRPGWPACQAAPAAATYRRPRDGPSALSSAARSNPAAGPDEREHALGRLGQLSYALEEEALEVAREGQPVGQRVAAGELRGRQGRRELEQGEGIAVRLRDEDVAHRRSDSAVTPAPDQRRGRVAVERPELERLEIARLEAVLPMPPSGEHHRDALGVQPPGDEEQGVRRRRVQPLRVVHEAQHRSLLREFGQEGEARDGDEEPVLTTSLGQPERSPERHRLRPREAIEQRQPGTDQLVQAGERQLGLRLDAARREHVHPGGALARVLEQRRLAETRVTAQDERAAPGGARRLEQRTETGALLLAPEECSVPGALLGEESHGR